MSEEKGSLDIKQWEHPSIACPFCGSRDIEIISDYYAFVHCKTCKACGPRGETRDEAIKAWKKRYDRVTYRKIKRVFDNSRIAWCEAGNHEMNMVGAYCIHCGRRVMNA